MSNGKKMYWAWPTRTVSIGAATTLIGYATYYATDILGLSAAAVAMMFMISKLFDGVTDFIVGIIIDKANFKLGKGRPYELAVIGMWGCIALFFCAPQTSKSAALVYLFVMYTLAYSIFATFLNCNESVYLSNALDDVSKSTTVTAVSSLVATAFALVINIILPQLVNTVGTTRGGWRMIAVTLAVIYGVFGRIRFFLIKEVRRTNLVEKKTLSIKKLLYLLFHNKYILLISGVALVANIITSLGVGTYYNKYILKNIGIGSLLSLSMFSVILAVAFVPRLAKKIKLRRTLQLFMAVGMAGYLLRLVDPKSIPIVFISSFLSMLAATVPIGFTAPLTIDSMDFGEWKHKERAEGIISSATSITTKLGGALGVWVTGTLLSAAGYNGTLEIQSASANHMIIALSSTIPAALTAIMIVLLQFYDLDGKIERIRAELKQNTEQK